MCVCGFTQRERNVQSPWLGFGCNLEEEEEEAQIGSGFISNTVASTLVSIQKESCVCVLSVCIHQWGGREKETHKVSFIVSGSSLPSLSER